MDTLSVIKVEMAGAVTSFRYPHFTQGYQPTFEMPPPSTIYGHICSAVGDYVDPNGWGFGYHFTHEGKFVDYKEHLHFDDPIQPFPFDRELLFNPRLTLYITNLDLERSFKNPAYTAVLGRSQDLVTYLSVKQVELQRAEAAYFEHTLLPLEMAPHLDRQTIAATMPRYIDSRRRTQWGSYALLLDTALWPPPQTDDPFADWDEVNEGMVFEGDMKPDIWVDPHSPGHRKNPGHKRAIWLHSFLKESY